MRKESLLAALFGLSLLLLLSGCSTNPKNSSATVNTAFDNYGLTSATRKNQIQSLILQKSSADPSQVAQARFDLKDAFDKVVAQCKSTLSVHEAQVSKSNKLGLSVAILGLISGSVIGPTLVAKGTASKSAIAAWSGIAGSTNVLQDSVKRYGYDPEIYQAKSTAIRLAIKKASLQIQEATTLSEMSAVLPELIATCVSES